jgi:hypothetical protein
LYASVAAATAAADFSVAKAPNITSQQYTQLVRADSDYNTNGGWTGILKDSANNGKELNLMRRVATSGTQAASNAFFLQYPCASGTALGQLFPAGKVENEIPSVFNISETASTGDLKTAIGGLATHFGAANVSASNPFAIGVVSLENSYLLETSAARSHYRFVKLDGVHPEGSGDTTYGTATSLDGSYPFVVGMRSFVADSQLSSYGAQVINAISTVLSNPSDCANDRMRGLTLDFNSTSTCTAFKGKATRNGKNCSPIQLYK